MGLIPVRDEETGTIQWVDTANPEVRGAFRADALRRNAGIKEAFKKSGVDYGDIGTHENYVKPLMTLFKKRESRR